MSDCQYIRTGKTRDGKSEYRCDACGHVRWSHYPPHLLHRQCPNANRDEHELNVVGRCYAGCTLAMLLQFIGISQGGSCSCATHARKMDANGFDWCRENADETIQVMQREAGKRGLVFVESQARWLLNLAIRIAEEQREPTRMERLRLRAMKIGNSLLNR